MKFPIVLALSITFLCSQASLISAQDWQEIHKISASEREVEDAFGYSVAIDGNIAIVGAPHKSTTYLSATNLSSAFIYELDSSGSWHEKQELNPNGGSIFDWFGEAVAISNNYAVVTAPQDVTQHGNPILFAGAAYVFEQEPNGQWSQVQKLTAPVRDAYERFGNSVSIDGNYIIIGSQNEDKDAVDTNFIAGAGAAYIFERDTNGNWNLVQKLVASDRKLHDNFGNSVSVQGNSAVIGAVSADLDYTGNYYDAGAAYFFERDSNGVWHEAQRLVASNKGISDNFGFSVALSGKHIIIGAMREDGDSVGLHQNSGAAYIFKRIINGTWIEVQKVVPSYVGYERWFGRAVSISGTRAIFAGGNKDYKYSGSGYLFEQDSLGIWNEVHVLNPFDTKSGNRFSGAVAISGDHIIVGASYDSDDASGGNTLVGAGSAYIFESELRSCPEPRNLQAINITPNSAILSWFEVPQASEYIIHGGIAGKSGVTEITRNKTYKIVTGLKPVTNYNWQVQSICDQSPEPVSDFSTIHSFITDSSGEWNEIKKLTASDRGFASVFGSAVSIDDNYAIVGAPLESEDASGSNTIQHAGAAYIFEKDINGNWKEVQKLLASDRSTDNRFGSAVDINGNYAIIGVWYKSAPNGNTVYIFERDNAGAWNEVKKVSALESRFGHSLSISGNCAVVGSYYANRVHIIERNAAGIWSEVQQLGASDPEPYADFGVSVSISGDFAIIGADRKDEGPTGWGGYNEAGAAYIIKRNAAGIWNHVKKLEASDQAANDYFGGTVSIDGNFAVIGAISEDQDANGEFYAHDAGSAYVFEQDSFGNWNELQKLVPFDRTRGDRFGYNVSVSGRYILASSWYENEDEAGEKTKILAGSAYLFKYDESKKFNEIQKIVASDRSQKDYFGYASHLSENHAIIGAYLEDHDTSGINFIQNAGSAYIFELEFPPCEAPSNLRSTSLSGTSVKLEWDASTDACSFNIYGKEVGTAGFRQFGPSNRTKIIAKGLLPNTQYIWRVQAICSGNPVNKLSPLSPIDTFITDTLCPDPGPLSVSNITFDGATLNWNGIADAASYSIYFGKVGGWSVTIPISNPLQTNYVINGSLKSNTLYEWTIQTTCVSNGASNYATINQFTTDPQPSKLLSNNLVQAESETFELIIFPNPTNDIINIILPDEIESNDLVVSLLDINGRSTRLDRKAIDDSNIVSISTLSVHPGIYQLVIQTEHQSITKKLSIVR